METKENSVYAVFISFSGQSKLICVFSNKNSAMNYCFRLNTKNTWSNSKVVVHPDLYYYYEKITLDKEPISIY